MKKIIITVFFLIFSFTFVNALGEIENSSTSTLIDLEQIITPINEKITTNPDESVDSKNNLLPGEKQKGKVADFMETRNQKITETQDRAMEMIKKAEDLRSEKREEIEEKKALFKERMGEIVDNQLRNRVERLSENINRVNENLSDRYTGLISAIEIILDKIESRLSKIEEERGVNLSNIYLMIDETRGLIENSRNEIINQKSKVYIVEISSEEELKTDFQSVMQELKNDHKNLREKNINSLRFTIRDIMKELRNTLSQENDNNENSEIVKD